MKKREIAINELYEGFPKEFQDFINYIKLEFTEVPLLWLFKTIFKKIIEKNNNKIDYYFDWDKENPNIDENNIYTNNYNGKNKWLIKNNIFNKINNLDENRILKKSSNIYLKPIFSINHIPNINNSKTIKSVNSNLQNIKTIDDNHSNSKVNEINHVSNLCK